MRQIVEWSVLLYVSGELQRRVMAVAGRKGYTVLSFERYGALMIGTSQRVAPDGIDATADRMEALVEEWRATPDHRVVFQNRVNPRAKLC